VNTIMATVSATEQINAFLSNPSQRNAILAVNQPQGGPQLTPVWYVWDGEAFWFSIRNTSTKYRHITRAPDISVLVDEPATASYVLAYGRAEVLTENLRTYSVLRTMLEKYTTPDNEIEEGLDELTSPVRVLVRLRPQQFVTRWAN
jgi:PPOX class probable F420-dependent enzyme